jgi:hypothetical protein
MALGGGDRLRMREMRDEWRESGGRAGSEAVGGRSDAGESRAPGGRKALGEARAGDDGAETNGDELRERADGDLREPRRPRETGVPGAGDDGRDVEWACAMGGGASAAR